MTNAVHLSHVEFDIAWDLLRLGERPYPISVPTFGVTADERAVLRDRALHTMAERGLHDGRDLHPRLEDLLVLMVRNRFTVDGQLWAGRYLRVLAAGGGEHGALAVQSDDEVRIERVRATNVVGALVALLPAAEPGPGGAVSLPRTLFDEAVSAYASGGHLALETALRRGGITGRDLRGLSTLLESGRRAGGQLAANSMDRVGRRTRTPVLNFFDTEAGRYLLYTEPRRDGQQWLTCAPGGSDRVAHRLNELVTRLDV
ncbi:MAG: ESX secretion-associated protein EspG [Labedaea sp.]